MLSTYSTRTPPAKIINGDCIEVLQRVPDASIDLVVTDPPFIVRYTSKDGRGYPNDDNVDWLAPAFREVHRVLKQDRFCLCFYSWKHAARFLEAWEGAGFKPVGHLVWTKDYASRTGVVQYRHDLTYVLAKGNPRPERILRDVLPYQFEGNRLHPAQRPVSALRPLISAFSKPGDIVLDPFAGSGTTGVAAKRLGRRFLGIELDQRYHRIAAQRLSRS